MDKLITCDLYDDYLDNCEVASLPWQHLGGRRSFSGPAQTVRCYEDNSRLSEAVDTPGDGRVLVVDGGCSLTTALMGDCVAERALRNGWVRVVIAGMARDRDALAALDIGVVALGTVPRKSRKEGAGTIGEMIMIGGARVNPGDQVVVDSDGILILPQAAALS